MPFTAADANRVAFKYVKEVTFGTTPASALKLLRYNSHNIGMKANFVSSNEIRSDRQRSDTILTSKTSDGDVNLEWSYASPDDLIEGALQSTWSSALTLTGTTLSLNATTSTITNSLTTMPNFPIGSWISVAGFAGVNGPRFFCKVATRSTTVITYTHASQTLTGTEAAGSSITLQHQGFIRNGSTPTSFTLESQFADLTTTFLNHKGMRVNTMGLNVTSSQIVTGTFGFMGLGTLLSTTTVGTGADTAAPTNSVMSESNIGALYENGVLASAVSFKTINMTLNNNLRAQDYLGSAFPGGVGSGTLDVTATIQAYFSDTAFYTKFVNNTPTALAMVLEGSDGGSYVIELPKVRITSATVVPPGINTDVMIDGTVTAYRHPTDGYTIQITRLL